MASKSKVLRTTSKAVPKPTFHTFPLYDKLVSQVEQKKTEELDPKVWPQLSKLDKHNAEIVYYLILHYARLHGSNEDIPYARKVQEGGRGVIYDVENIPHPLKLILVQCIHEITGS